MPDYEATFRAIADFSALAREARSAREEIRRLKEEGEAATSSSSTGITSVVQLAAKRAISQAAESERRALAAATAAVAAHAAAARLDASSTSADARAHEQLGRAATGAVVPMRTIMAQMVQMQQARRALTTSERESSDVLRVHSTRLQDHSRVIDQNGAAVGRQAISYRSASREMASFDSTTQRSKDRMTEYGVSVRAVAQEMLAFRSVSRDISRTGPPRFPTLFGGAGSGGGGSAISAVGGGSGGGSPPNFRPLTQGAGDASNALEGLFGIASKFPWLWGLMASAVGPLISGLGALGGAAVGLANSLGSLVGVGAALPGVLAAMGTGVASVVVGILPLIDAFKAYQKVQDAAQTSTRDVTDSQDRLAKAEIAHANAQRGVHRAQLSLNDARKQAIKDLRDLRIEVSRASLNEEGAVASLQEAQDQYRQTLADATATDADRATALYRVHQAEADLADVRQKNADNQAALTDAERKGVEGSDRVVQAREALSSAQQVLTQSSKDLTQAQQDLAGGGQAAAKAQQELNDILAKMTPTQRTFAEGLLSMRDSLSAIQDSVGDALLGPLVSQLGSLRSLLPVVNRMLTDSAGAVGKVAARGLEMMASGPWRRDFVAQGRDNAQIIEDLGFAGLSLADALRNVTRAAAPFTLLLTRDVRRLAEWAANTTSAARESGRLASWLDLVYERTRKWFEVLVNVTATLFNFGAAASEFGTWILDNLVTASRGWREFSETQRRAGSPFKEWLEDIKPLLSAGAGLLVTFAKGVLSIASDPENIRTMTKMLMTLSNDILPTIVRLVNDLADSGIAASVLDVFSQFLAALEKFLDSGGAGALNAFFYTFGELASAILTVMSWGPIPRILGAVAIGFGALSAALVVGRFSGLFLLVDGLAKLLGMETRLRGLNLSKLLGGTGGFLGKAGTAAAGTTLATAGSEAAEARTLIVAGTELQAAAAALTRAAVALGASGVAPGVGGTAARGAGARAAEAAGAATAGRVATGAEVASTASRIGRLARLADPLLWAGLAAGVGTSFLPSGRAKSYTGAAGAVLTGAGTGAMLGSVVPGIGTALGAGVGAVAGAAWSAFRDSRIQRDFKQYISDPVRNFFTKTIPDAGAAAWRWIRETLIGGFSNFFTRVGPRAVGRFFSDLPRNMVRVESVIYGAFLGVVDRVHDLFTRSIPSWFSSFRGFFNRQVSTPVSSFAARVPSFFTRSVPQFFAAVPGWFNRQVARPIGTWVAGLPTFFARTVPHFFSSVWTWFRAQVVTPINAWIRNIPSAVRRGFSWLGSLFGIDQSTVSSTRKAVSGRASGGSLPEGVAWVGEQGPELAIKSGSNVDIIANHDIPGFAAGTGFDFGASSAMSLSTSGFRSSRVSSISNNNSSTVNSGVTVEKIEINNPRPEPASDSIRRTIQKVTYYGTEGR